jgi:amidohydrolase
MIALRADMDGLPVTERTDVPFASRARDVYNGEEVGVMHACGHDTHVAILMGVAEILSAVRNEIPGSIKFIFQPAEEGPPEGEKGGAPMMLEEGVLGGVEAIFALHIDAQREVGGIYYRSGGIMASVDDFRITLTGRQTHGAAPWQGVDPIVTSAQIINSLQTIVSRNVDVTQSAAVVTVGSIHGGVRSNIIPEEVVMVGTIRALEPAVREAIHERVREIVSNTAESMGVEAKVEIPMTFGLPVTYNDPDLTSRMLPTLEKVAGAHRVHLVAAETGAEDFSVFAEKVPGFYFFLGGRPANISEEESASHHTPDFFVDESGFGLGVRAMTGLALDYLNQAGAR